jgi:hypothetical protein
MLCDRLILISGLLQRFFICHTTSLMDGGRNLIRHGVSLGNSEYFQSEMRSFASDLMQVENCEGIQVGLEYQSTD